MVPGFRRDDVWTPAPAPDADPGFAGVTGGEQAITSGTRYDGGSTGGWFARADKSSSLSRHEVAVSRGLVDEPDDTPSPSSQILTKTQEGIRHVLFQFSRQVRTYAKSPKNLP